MQYLNKATLKAILHLLYNKGRIELSYFNNLRNKNIILDINSYELQDVFSFKVNKEYVDSNIDKIKNIYDGLGSEDSDAIIASLRKITKTLIENSADIDIVDLINISSSNYYLLVNEALILNLKENQKEKLMVFLDEYIAEFKKDLLTAQKHKYYSFGKNLSEIITLFTSYIKDYGKRFIIQVPLNEGVRYGVYNPKLRLAEILLYMLEKQYIDITTVVISKIKYQTKKENILNINITLNKTPSEIYNLEKEPVSYSNVSLAEDLSQDNSIVYKLSYNSFTGDIFINDSKLKSPHYDSANRIVFAYLYNNPDKVINIDTLDAEVNRELNEGLKKPLSKVAQELGFTGDRKKLFFKTTINTARLRTEITKKELKEARVNTSKILP